ncbi:SRPBCC family protein [Mycobacterium hubeiense]|uniref:SRPBCC family protein n=1 Tax=Mycobacterium hubeiense TaxID=1867256 RepID=UPI000C7F716F|nr:SRPBCC family protein [Mycobacterium sp. QGD 101]
MALIQAFATVHRSAADMWREVGPFQSIVRWHPLLMPTDGSGEEPGAERTMATTDGRRWVERLRETDPEQRLYRYDASSSDLPITDFEGEFRIREDAPHKSTVIWTARFAVTSGNEKDVNDAVRHFLRAGVRGIERRYARPTAAAPHDVSTLWHRP